MPKRSKLPQSREQLFIDIHRDIHVHKKQSYLVIRDLSQQSISYTEARHMVHIAVSEPDPQICLERYLQGDIPTVFQSADPPTGILRLAIVIICLVDIMLMMILLLSPNTLVESMQIRDFFILLILVHMTALIPAWHRQQWGFYLLGSTSFLMVALGLGEKSIVLMF